MWFKKIKKKKFQFLLVALMLCFTSAIFAACISFVAEVSYYTDDYISYENCPRVITMADEKYDRDYFTGNAELMEHTEEINFCDAMILQNLFYFHEEQIKTAVNNVYFVENINDFIHSLKLLDGTGTAPGYGEIWINSVSAEEDGIEVGDTVYYGKTGEQADAENAGISMSYTEIPNVMVSLDTVRIAQVMENLIGNSIKYRKKQEKIEDQIKVSFRMEEKEFFVKVTDNGQGIAAEDLPFVFERFFRGDKARTQSIPGSGLGLSIAKYIVEQHGGVISCDSILGQGTTVEFGFSFV